MLNDGPWEALFDTEIDKRITLEIVHEAAERITEVGEVTTVSPAHAPKPVLAGRITAKNLWELATVYHDLRETLAAIDVDLPEDPTVRHAGLGVALS